MKQGLPALFWGFTMSSMMTACVSERIYSGTDIPVKERQLDKAAASKERLRLGLTYLQKGNAEQAKYNLDKAMEYAPESEDVYIGMAYYYQTVGDNKRAEKAYLNAIETKNATGDSKNNFGVFLCRQQQYDRAEQMFLAALNTPKYTRVASSYENLGICSRDAGNIAQAKDYFVKALKYDSKRSTARLELVKLSVQEHNFEFAKDQLTRYHHVIGTSVESLSLGIKIAQNLGDNDQATHYGTQLLSTFPSSEQAKQYRANLDQ